MKNNTSDSETSWLLSRTGIVTVVAVSVLGFLIYQGHGAHLLGIAPYFLLLLCPLMHIFMHRGHQRNPTDDKSDFKNKKKPHEGGCH